MEFDPVIAAQAQSLYTEFEPQIDRLEQKRKSAWVMIALVFFFPVLLSGAGLLITPPENPLQYALVTLGIASLLTLSIYRTMRRGQWLLHKPLSHMIVRRILGPAYRPWGIISAEELEGHHILPAHSRLYREEGYAALLHGYRVRFQEIDAVRSFHPASVREWHETSLGSGLYIHVEMKRDLPAHTILLSKGTMRSVLKKYLKRTFGAYKSVGLVSPRFHDKYDVLSTDQIEARVAFHPAFIEKFLIIADTLQAQSLEASFKDNALLIHARYKKDLFQLGHFFRPLNTGDIERLITELKVYADIIGTVRLNPYTSV